MFLNDQDLRRQLLLIIKVLLCTDELVDLSIIFLMNTWDQLWSDLQNCHLMKSDAFSLGHVIIHRPARLTGSDLASLLINIYISVCVLWNKSVIIQLSCLSDPGVQPFIKLLKVNTRRKNPKWFGISLLSDKVHLDLSQQTSQGYAQRS